MDFEEYQKLSAQTATGEEEFPDFINARMVRYGFGLAEMGEVQEKIKKAIREDDPSYLEDIPYEIGDGFWYMAQLVVEIAAVDEVDFDGDLGDVAEMNIDKVMDRKERGALTGEGDHR